MVTRPNPARASIASLVNWFSRGQWTPSEYLRYCLRRIETENPKIRAVLEVYEDEAKAAAAASTRRYRARRPTSFMDGIPVGIKANIAFEGHTCHGGIKAYENTIAQKDAKVVHNLRAAGAVILCSLNMEEGALGAATDNPWFGRTFNPLREGFTPGGSSGGSAAAVAAGMVPAALGTDTMGSVRIPSAYCGLVGHKPSQDLVSKDGVMPLSKTLDCAGPHVRHLEDAAIILPIMAGTRRPFSLTSYGAIRFACVFIHGDVDIEPEVRAAFSQLAEILSSEDNFNRRDDCLKDYDFSKQRRAGLLISEVEGAHYHTGQYEKDPEGFSEHFQSLLGWGVRQSAEKLRGAYDWVQKAQNIAEMAFKDTDIIIAPTTPHTAFRFGDPIPAGQADFTAFANFAGLPAVSIPMGRGKNKMPIGMQIIGPKGRDEYVLQAACRIRDLIA